MATKSHSPRLRRLDPLPIDAYLPEILGVLDAHQVVILQAETGAGKTTRVCQAVLGAVLQGGLELDIWMTQPRRAAVRWNGARIAHELGDEPGGLVGWSLHGDEPVESRHTRIHLRVDQSMVNWVRHHERLPEGLLIIDEAHERSLSIDLLLGMVKELLPASPNTRVLIMSATIDAEKFSAYFGGAPVINIKGRCYPVRTEVLHLLHTEHHTEGAARAAISVVNDFTAGKLLVPRTDGSGTVAVSGGKVLVLLPGKEDIRSVMEEIARHVKVKDLEARVSVLSCHGESTPDEQDAVQAPVTDGNLVIVCGTEILRSSVTVRDTIGVIDSLQVKRNLVDARGVAHLTKVAVSRAEADQGKGRAGRTQPGFYIPISFNNEYEGLNPYPLPATQREPVTSVALQVAAMDRSIRTFPFLDPPAVEKVDVAIRRLKQVGALDAKEKITELGELLVQFPLDPERAKALVTADTLGVLPEVVVVVATLEEEGFFHPPKARGDIGKLTVHEGLARLILSHVCKNERWDTWERASNPRDPAQVDLHDLPSWMSPVGDGLWEANLRAYDCPFDNPRAVSDLQYQQWAGESRSDFTAIVRAYRAFKAEENRLRDVRFTIIRDGEEVECGLSNRERENFLRDWCMAHFINYKRIRMAEQAMYQIREELLNSPLHLRNGFAHEREFSSQDIIKALASGLTDNIGYRREYGYQSGLGEFTIAYNSVCKSGPKLVLVGGIHKIPAGRRGEVVIADTAAPVEANWLQEVMPHLCKSERLNDHHYDPERDEVMETEILYLLDQEIGAQKSAALNNEAASLVFATWLANQTAVKNLPGLGEHNRAVLSQSTALNMRAGEPLFALSSSATLAAWLLTQLTGVRSLSGIADPDALRLPALDEELVQIVIADNPDQIEVLGASCPVEYRAGYAPRIILRDAMDGNRWLQLPDEGIALPGGKLVQVEVYVDRWNSTADTNIVQLKSKLRDHGNAQAWEAWSKQQPPQSIAMPDPSNEGSGIPDVITTQYGNCVITGEPLFAYGTMAIKTGRIWDSDPWFVAAWYRQQADAETARASAVAKFDNLRQQRREAAELAQLNQQSNALCERIRLRYQREVERGDRFPALTAQLRAVYQQYPGHPELYLATLRAWSTAAEAILAEADRLYGSGPSAKKPSRPDSPPPTRTTELQELMDRFGSRSRLTDVGKEKPRDKK